MLSQIFFNIVESVTTYFSGILPAYEDFPFPDFFLPNLENIFGKMFIFSELPLIREVVPFFWWAFGIWWVYYFWNTILDYLSLIPFLGKITVLKR